MDNCNSLSKKYEQSFDPMTYLDRFYATDGRNPSVKSIYSWTMSSFHDIFETGKVKGSRLLDLGTGPIPHSVMSAVPHCKNIVLSEFTPKSRDFLKLWLDGQSPFDFSHFFKYTVDIEGKGELAGDRETQLKDKITAILPLDLLKDNVVSPCYVPKFPIITSVLTLEAASSEYAEYKKIAARVTSLLETGGHLLLCGVFNQTSYSFGGVTYETCSMSPKQVKDAWTGCGLKIVTWKEEKVKMTIKEGNVEIFVMCAKKM